MKPYQQFKLEGSEEIKKLGENKRLAELTNDWMNEANQLKYSYHYEWLGRPVIQYPQDIVAMQELIWEIKPDLIIETGIAHGGSLIFSASMLALLDMCETIETGKQINPDQCKRKVLGLDIDIRTHNYNAIESHPMYNWVQMIEGSSTDPEIIKQVHDIAKDYHRILVCLDSNHTHDHVLAELESYAPLVSTGSYCCVFDTVIEDMPENLSSNRPWGPGDNAKTAVWEYIAKHPEFEIDKSIQDKLLITVAPDGYLKRVK